MNTLSGLDNGLAFHSRPKSAAARFLAAVRTYGSAMAEGLAAARTYQELISRGETHEAALAKAFDRHLRHG